jgi:hypothetical protein
MAALLRLNDVPVETVFDLLGRKENDITYAFGWGLAQAPTLMKAFLELTGAPSLGYEAAKVDLQLHRAGDAGAGITDIEITTPATKVIVEAKRGWNLPDIGQLAKYAPRLASHSAPDKRLVVLTQWGEEEYVRHHLGAQIDGHPITTVGLGKIAHAARYCARQERQVRLRQLLDELARYLVSVADMGNPHDNSVYVVSLNSGMSEAGVSYIDVVESLGIYWYPATGSGGWPKVPPNYMAFRYGGKLRGSATSRARASPRSYPTPYLRWPSRRGGQLSCSHLGRPSRSRPASAQGPRLSAPRGGRSTLTCS